MLTLNKSLFSRNKRRERDVSDVFNKTSSSINSVMPYVVILFFAPVLITTSIFSKEIFLMLANILLSFGYVSNFVYRVFNKEVSKAELIASPFIFLGFLGLVYYLSPVITGLTFISFLVFSNKVAAAVNLYFLAKHIIIPPFKRLIEQIASFFNLDIRSSYYARHELTLEEDRHTIDKLLKQNYQHDSFSKECEPEKLSRLNRLLKKLCDYISKYEETAFGYFIRREAIADLESRINALTILGDSDSSYTFIRRKICYKETKIKLLEQAKSAIVSAQENSKSSLKEARSYFSDASRDDWALHRTDRLNEANECVDTEINRQRRKIHELEDCLPMNAP